MTRDSDTVYFKEKHLVSVEIVHTGLVRFSLMMDMTAPGTVPDPLLIAALIDLVSNRPAFARSRLMRRIGKSKKKVSNHVHSKFRVFSPKKYWP